MDAFKTAGKKTDMYCVGNTARGADQHGISRFFPIQLTPDAQSIG